MTYIAQWRYHSSLCERYGLGRLEAGVSVDVDPDVAAAINLDSPGVLVAGGAAADGGGIDPIPADRMIRKPGRKRAAG